MIRLLLLKFIKASCFSRVVIGTKLYSILQQQEADDMYHARTPYLLTHGCFVCLLQPNRKNFYLIQGTYVQLDNEHDRMGHRTKCREFNLVFPGTDDLTWRSKTGVRACRRCKPSLCSLSPSNLWSAFSLSSKELSNFFAIKRFSKSCLSKQIVW